MELPLTDCATLAPGAWRWGREGGKKSGGGVEIPVCGEHMHFWPHFLCVVLSWA